MFYRPSTDGDQEAPIVEMARPITKFSHLVSSADEIETVAMDAWKAATTGRPGPVWIDVPIDLQEQRSQLQLPLLQLMLMIMMGRSQDCIRSDPSSG